MKKLAREDLLPLEAYAESRDEFRARVLAHKRDRQVRIGANVTLSFEDRLTIQYQIQEMLRIERIFERAAIEEELSAYNPLIPDGANLKATMMIEFPDPAERRAALAELKGIEDRVWLRVGTGARAFAVADEDLERSNDAKTSAVHFLRLELDPAALKGLAGGEDLAIGIDHPSYRFACDPVEPGIRAALVRDLD